MDEIMIMAHLAPITVIDLYLCKVGTIIQQAFYISHTVV